MTKWTHIHIEGYCMFRTLSKKNHALYTVTNFDKMETAYSETRRNEHYVNPKERPKWCKEEFKNGERTPQEKCLCNPDTADKCPFFMFSDCEPEEYIGFDVMFNLMGLAWDEETDERCPKKTKKLFGMLKKFRDTVEKELGS